MNVQLLCKRVTTVGELVKALSQLPSDASISPFGSESCKLVYKEKENRAYLDEDLTDILTEEEYTQLEDQYGNIR